jgi:hypothetical protein
MPRGAHRAEDEVKKQVLDGAKYFGTPSDLLG